MPEYTPPLCFEAPFGTFGVIVPTAKVDRMTVELSMNWDFWPDRSLLRDLLHM